jgi:DNA invertase Pin-like site-specific DNA recombinase
MEIKQSGFAYGYVRVSSLKQAEGLSVENQSKMINKWAKKNNLKVINIVSDEAVSGTSKTKNRPKMREILAVLAAGDVFITYSVSRLSRNYPDAVVTIDAIKKRGAFFVSISPSEGYDTRVPGGEMIMQIMSMFAAAQAVQISSMTKDSAEYMKQNGIHHSTPPYGWTKKTPVKGSGLIEVPEEQKIIALMREMRTQNDDNGRPTSWYAITQKLNDMKIPTPRNGKTWSVTVVRGICERTSVDIKGSKEVKNAMLLEAAKKTNID